MVRTAAATRGAADAGALVRSKIEIAKAREQSLAGTSLGQDLTQQLRKFPGENRAAERIVEIEPEHLVPNVEETSHALNNGISGQNRLAGLPEEAAHAITYDESFRSPVASQFVQKISTFTVFAGNQIESICLDP